MCEWIKGADQTETERLENLWRAIAETCSDCGHEVKVGDVCPWCWTPNVTE